MRLFPKEISSLFFCAISRAFAANISRISFATFPG